MADTTSFGTNDPNTQKAWSTDMFDYIEDNMELTPLMGTGGDSFIHVNSDLTGRAGDKVGFPLENPLTAVGGGDDSRAEDNIEALVVDNFELVAHERVKGHRAAGKISMKRTALNVREAAKRQLGKWMANQIEDDAVAALAGLYNKSGVETVNESEPSSDRILYIGQTNAGVVISYASDALLSAATNTDAEFGTKIIEIAKRAAYAADPQLEPVMIDGVKAFVCLVSRLQAKSLRADTAWLTAAQQADVRSRAAGNRIWGGAIGFYAGVLVIEYDRIPSRTGAGGTTPAEGFLLNAARTATTDAVASGKTVDRALFLGRQSACMGWAAMPSRTEFLGDMSRIPETSIDAMYGIGKTVFSRYVAGSDTNTEQEDYAVICIDTQVIIDPTP